MVFIKSTERKDARRKVSNFNKSLVMVVGITILVLMIFSLPALASVYRYTGTHFRYIGDIFHEKVVEFDHGMTGFQISGRGSVSGSQQVTTVDYKDTPGNDVYSSKAANLSLYLYGTTADDAPEDRKVRMISGLQVDLTTKAEIVTGVEMDPGESGYIKQDAVTSSSKDGEYMKVTNNFGNTGGTTKREMDVEGFVKDSMSVEGYAEVWETTTVRSGDGRGGWWNTLP